MDCLLKFINADSRTKIITSEECSITFRLDINSEQQWFQWLDSFMLVSGTKWLVRLTDPDKVQYQYRKRYICKYNNLRGEERNHQERTKCPASIDVKIENLRDSKSKGVMDGYPCLVQMNLNHNHGFECVDALTPVERQKLNYVLNYIKVDGQAVVVEAGDNKVSFRLSISNEEQWLQWLESFQCATSTSWNARSTFRATGHFQFKNIYICQHNNFRSANRVYKTSTKCPAAIKVKIMNVPSVSANNDLVMEDYLCSVEMHVVHNHALDCAEALNHLRPNRETKETFYSFFDNGLPPCEALRVNEIKVMSSGDIADLANSQLHPKPRSVYSMWDIYRKKAFGSYMRSDMLEAIEKYSSIVEGTIYLKKFESHYACVIITPFMTRVHEQEKRWKEIVFVDTTSNLDQTNCAVTVMLCASAVGAMPLAVLVSSAQDEKCYTEAFSLVQKVLGASAFFGNGHPTIFMTDDDKAERNALANIWPESTQLLCIFHVLQAVWRWGCAANNGVSKEHRKQLLNNFKNIVYSHSAQDADKNYRVLVLSCNTWKYHNFLSYIDKLMARRHEWCLCDRRTLLTRGNNTNNCCEATIKIIKDVICDRCKLFNPCMVVKFMTEIFSQYFESRILNVVFGKKKSASLKKPVVPLTSITSLSTSMYKVDSTSAEGVVYDVDVEAGTCTCVSGFGGDFCKHLQSIVIHQHLQSDQMFQGTPEEKYRLACVALGVEKAPAMSFFENLSKTTFVPPSDVATSLNNDASDDDFKPTHSQTQGVVDQVDQAQEEAMIRETNVTLLRTLHEMLLSKSEALLGTEQLNEALMKLVRTVTNTKSANRLCSMMHSWSSSQPYRRGGRKIRVQPTSIARRSKGSPRCAAPLGKGRKPACVTHTAPKRQRNLAANVALNRPNAKSH